MPIEFVDPRPPCAETPAAPVAPRRAPRADRSLTIGLLANGFPDSARFLEHLATMMRRRGVAGAEFRAVTKASPPVPLTVAQNEGLTACDAVVAAYGH